MNMIKSVFLAVTLFNFQAVFAKDPYVCKTDDEKTHQIAVMINDGTYVIQDNWNGPYKTSARYTGIILPLHNSIILRNAETRPGTIGILSYNEESNVFTFEYSGFLAPNTKGVVNVKCNFIRWD